MPGIGISSKNQVIFLNGASSSGKSTMAKFMQTQLPKPYMHIGIDKLTAMMPEHLNSWEENVPKEGFWWKCQTDVDGEKTYHFQLGSYAKLVNNSLKNICIAMLNSGLNIIIDNVCIDNNSYQMWKNKPIPSPKIS